MNLIIGANGQLGTELCRLFDEKSISYVGTTTNELDITNREQVNKLIHKLKPKVIFDCAAYTAVDAAEDEGRDLNYLVNVEGTRNIALAAQENDATLIYISTDYVFDGELKGGEYQVDSPTNPQNEYGKSKLQGEEVIKEIMSTYYIIRTSWVFGEFGSNFVYTMQKLAETRDTLTIVSDQVGRPTWTRTLVEFIEFLVDKKADYGIYHLSNQGECSWYEFAKEILKENKSVSILPVTSAEFPQKAKRPQYSIMDLSKSEEIGFKISEWKEALHQFLNRK